MRCRRIVLVGFGILATWFVVLVRAQPTGLISTVISDERQAHGDRYCRAKYVDQLGVEHFDNFQVAKNDDIQDVIAVRAALFAVRLAEQEAEGIADIIVNGGPAPATLDFTTWTNVRAVLDVRKLKIDADISRLTIQKTRIDNAGLEAR